MLDANKWVGAECSDKKYDPDIWFNIQDETYAKSICRICPLLITCAQYAIESNEEFGVWGGLTPNERRALRSKRKTWQKPQNKVN